VEVLPYAPTRPVVDYSVAFLWLMSVATVTCASLWADITAPDQFDERYNELSPKVFSMKPYIYLNVYDICSNVILL